MVPPNQPFQRGFATYKTSSYWATPMFLRPILDRSSLPSLDAACSSQMNWYVIVSVCQHIFLKFVRLCFSKKNWKKCQRPFFFPWCWGPPLLPWVSMCIHVGSVQCAKPVLIQCAELAARRWCSPFFCASFDQVVAYMKNVIGYRICMTRRWIGTYESYEDVRVDMTWHDMTIRLIKCAIVRDTESNLNGWSLTWHNTTWHRV